MEGWSARLDRMGLALALGLLGLGAAVAHGGLDPDLTGLAGWLAVLLAAARIAALLGGPVAALFAAGLTLASPLTAWVFAPAEGIPPVFAAALQCWGLYFLIRSASGVPAAPLAPTVASGLLAGAALSFHTGTSSLPVTAGLFAIGHLWNADLRNSLRLLGLWVFPLLFALVVGLNLSSPEPTATVGRLARAPEPIGGSFPALLPPLALALALAGALLQIGIWTGRLQRRSAGTFGYGLVLACGLLPVALAAVRGWPAWFDSGLATLVLAPLVVLAGGSAAALWHRVGAAGKKALLILLCLQVAAQGVVWSGILGAP